MINLFINVQESEDCGYCYVITTPVPCCSFHKTEKDLVLALENGADSLMSSTLWLNCAGRQGKCDKQSFYMTIFI